MSFPSSAFCVEMLSPLNCSIDLANTVLIGEGLDADLQAELVDEIKRLTGVRLEMVNEPASSLEGLLQERHVIAGGCLNNSSWVEYAYFREWAHHDMSYPGAGGYLLRTLVGPTGGNNLLFLGAGDRQGQAKAIQAFLGHVERQGTVLGALHEVELGPGVEILDKGELADILAPIDHDRQRYTFNRFSLAALRFLYMPDDKGRKALHDITLDMARAGQGPTDMRWGSIEQSNHYFSHRMILYWQQIESLGIFTADERAVIISALLSHTFSVESLGCLEMCKANTGKHADRHLMMMALNGWLAADYFQRRLPDYYDWAGAKQVIESYFEAIWQTSCGGGRLIEGYGSYLTVVMQAALLMGRAEVLLGEPMRLWAERLIAVSTNMGLMCLGQQTDISRWSGIALRLAAYLYGDGRFSYVNATRQRALAVGVNDTPDSSFIDPRQFPVMHKTRCPEDHIGIKVLPADRLQHRLTAEEIDFASAFDTITLRGGYGFDDDYVLFQGMRGCFKYSPNVGALIGYERHGYHMLGDMCSGIVPRDNQIRNINTVSIQRDGRFGNQPGGAVCVEQQRGERECRFTIKVADYNGGDWYRSVVWRSNEFLWVRDWLAAKEDGEYDFCVYWNAYGCHFSQGAAESFRYEGWQQSPAFLHVQCLAKDMTLMPLQPLWPTGVMPRGGATNLLGMTAMTTGGWPMSITARHRGVLETGQGCYIDTLIHSQCQDASLSYRITQSDAEGVVVNDEAIACSFVPGAKVVSSSLDLKRRKIASALLVSEELRKSRGVDEDEAIVASGEGEGYCVTASLDGVLTLYDGQGSELWRRQLSIHDEIKAYPWWTWATPLAMSVLIERSGDGELMIIVGSASSSLMAYNEQGDCLWHKACGWGAVSLLKSLRALPGYPALVAVGHGGLSACGRLVIMTYEGEIIKTFELGHRDEVIRSGMYFWDICDCVGCELVRGDDGDVLILVRAGTFNTVTVYDWDCCEPLWYYPVARYVTGFHYDCETDTMEIVAEDGLTVTLDKQGRQLSYHWQD